MPDIELPTSWLGIVGLAILVLGWVLVTRQRNIKADVADTKSTAEATLSQVQNGHADRNLRDDIDRLLELAKNNQGDIHGIRQDVSDLRGELRDEREARGDLEDRVRRLIRKRWPW